MKITFKVRKKIKALSFPKKPIALLIACYLAGPLPATTYYNQSGGNANTLTNWGTAANGTGTTPANFTTAGDIFNINNGTMYNSAAWTLGANVTLNINSTFNPASNYAITLSGTVNINTGGTYNSGTSGATGIGTLNVNGTGTFLESSNGTLAFTAATFSSTSNFTFNRGSNRFNGISQFNFGNLTFNDAFDGPPTLPAGNALQVQGNLTVMEVTTNFIISSTGSLTHTIGGNLIMNIASGSEYVYLCNGSGCPTLNIGGTISYAGTGGFFLNNGTCTPVLNVNGAGTSTFNNSFSNFVLCNSTGGGTVNFAGNISVLAGGIDVKSTVATGAVVPVLTVNGTTSLTGGTLSGNRSATVGSSVTVNLLGDVSVSATGYLQCTTNKGNATFTIGSSAAPANITSSGGTVHFSNDVDNSGATIGNATANIYGDIHVQAGGHVDLNYNTLGGNNIINVWGSAYMDNPTADLFGGPHCQVRTAGGPTLIFKTPVGITPVAGNLSLRTGNYGGGTLECTGCVDSRSAISQVDIQIESGRTITLKANIELGTNRSFTVKTGGTLITGAAGGTAYAVTTRTGYTNNVLCINAAQATNTSFTLQSGAMIDANSTDAAGALRASALLGNIQTDNRSYNSGGYYKFSATAAQLTGDFSTITTPVANTVDQLIVNNSNATVTTGLTLTNPVTITTSLQFLLGRLKTTTTNFPTIDVAGAASGFSTTSSSTAGTASFVDGPLRKIMNTTSTFIFPTGKSSGTAMYRPLAITPGSTTSDTYESELINTAPTASGYNAASLLAPLNWNNNAYFWWLTSGTGSVSNLVRAYYIDADISPAPKPFNSYVVVTEWSSGSTQWQSEGRSVVDSSTGSGGTFLHYVDAGIGVNIPTGITNRVQPFDIGTESSVILPIELLDFSASAVNNAQKLTWSTSTEKNNDHFTLERSETGTDFEFVAQVRGNGNSLLTNEYNYIDQKPLEGVSYYRLKQTDFNGRTVILKMILVIGKRPDAMLYPNPATREVFLKVDEGNSIVKIYNKEARCVFTNETTGDTDQVLRIDLANFASGIYYVHLITSGGEIKKYKFLKAHE